jgi:hypothetical protein
MKFEYQTTFVHVSYEEEESGALVFKEKHPPRIPIVESLTGNPNYEQHLRQMGQDGWELVSAQPLLLGVGHQNAIGYAGWGYSLTAGYYLFWKRRFE